MTALQIGYCRLLESKYPVCHPKGAALGAKLLRRDPLGKSLFCRPFFLPQKPAQEKFAAVGLAKCCRARRLLLETKRQSRSGAVGARGRFGVAIL